MNIYQSKYNQLPGTSHQEAIKSARYCHQKVQNTNPRRKTFVRSKYFKGDKVFLAQFWPHLMQKRRGDQIRRAKLYLCALDLLRNTSHSSSMVVEKGHLESVLIRFEGRTKDGILYIVQVKYNIRSERKDLISVYPVNKQSK